MPWHRRLGCGHNSGPSRRVRREDGGLGGQPCLWTPHHSGVHVENVPGGLYAAKHQRYPLRNMKTPSICCCAPHPAQIHMIPSVLVFGGEVFSGEAFGGE